MKKEKSNGGMNLWQIIGYLAIAVIVISIVNVGLRFTGKAISTSILNVTIEKNAKINFSVDKIDFGPGAIDIGKSSATLDTLGNVINGNWTPVTQGFVIENIGNVNLSLTLKTGKNASEFLGGANPTYQYNVTNIEESSCNPGSIVLAEWNNVNTTGDGTRICSLFQYRQNNNSVRVDLKLVIPADALSGVKSDIFTATGTEI